MNKQVLKVLIYAVLGIVAFKEIEYVYNIAITLDRYIMPTINLTAVLVILILIAVNLDDMI